MADIVNLFDPRPDDKGTVLINQISEALRLEGYTISVVTPLFDPETHSLTEIVLCMHDRVKFSVRYQDNGLVVEKHQDEVQGQ